MIERTKATQRPAELWDATVAVLEAASSPSGCALTTGLEQLSELVGADRADGGFVSSPASVYRPSALVAKPGYATAGFALSTADPIMASIFTTGSAIAVADFAADVPEGVCRSTMLEIGTRAVIARRLDLDERVFGLVCLDWVDDPHQVDEQLVDLVDLFVSSVLAPVLALSPMPKAANNEPRLLPLLSGAEIAAVRLAAKGLSYREIASILNKSVHTIDHQLLKARRQLGARNTQQLVQMLTPELQSLPEDKLTDHRQ